MFRAPTMPAALRRLLPLLFVALAAACAKKIGDQCSLNSDCSINGDRACDLAQPGGYCTVPGCEPNSCPTDSVCVYFDANEPRLRRRYCMAGCDGDADCRDGYRCVPFTAQACLNVPYNASMPARCNITFDTNGSSSSIPAGAGYSVDHAGYCVRAQ